MMLLVVQNELITSWIGAFRLFAYVGGAEICLHTAQEAAGLKGELRDPTRC